MDYDKELGLEITHLVINPILKTLRLAIDNDNTALQLQLTSLIRVILIKCHFWSPKLKDKEASDK